MEHADVKFLAGGRPIYAHRSVLSCQSDYFAAVFRFRYAFRRMTLADVYMCRNVWLRYLLEALFHCSTVYRIWI